MKVFIINGVPMSGKTQFCSFCQAYAQNFGGLCISISSVEIVKQIAKELGWDGLKTPKDRKFLSDLKKLLIDWNDIPYKVVQNTIMSNYQTWIRNGQSENNIIFFVHCREPEEINKYVERLGAKTIIVRREEVEKLEQSNTSDSEVLNYNYDIEIDNSGDIDNLNNKAIEFINNEIKY